MAAPVASSSILCRPYFLPCRRQQQRADGASAPAGPGEHAADPSGAEEADNPTLRLPAQQWGGSSGAIGSGSPRSPGLRRFMGLSVLSKPLRPEQGGLPNEAAGSARALRVGRSSTSWARSFLPGRWVAE